MYIPQLLAARGEYMRRARNAAFYRDVSPRRYMLAWQIECRANVNAAKAANREAVSRMRDKRRWN